MLTPDECRVLGVLIEKAQTTPGQYPLSLNALVNGCNQKSNREPVMNLNEDQVLRALDGLRMKDLIRELMLSGSRVGKYRHVARETLEVTTTELVILAELLLRGPQSIGDIRGRATRMHPIESLEVAQNVVNGLMTAGERSMAFVQELPPPPGSRAKRYAQLLCPDLHPLDAPAAAAESSPAAMPASMPTHASDDRIAELERQVAELQDVVRRMAASLGESDPFATS